MTTCRAAKYLRAIKTSVPRALPSKTIPPITITHQAIERPSQQACLSIVENV
jgi:hypothetical protein